MKITKLIAELESILNTITRNASQIDAIASTVHNNYTLSVKNLLHYLILRTFELRKYHDSLSNIGISSIRTSESYVYSNLSTIIQNLKLLHGTMRCNPIKEKEHGNTSEADDISFRKSKTLLKNNTNRLFKRQQKKHFAEIMVTLPLEAAEDKSIISQMADSGMEIARINLSHGTLAMWEAMVKFIKDINNKTSHHIKIYMDLSGPKFRTANLEIKSKQGKIKDSIDIRKGERIILTKRPTKGKKSIYNAHSEQLQKAEIGVLLPEIIDIIKVNDSVMFDDGMIKAKAISKTQDDVEIEIIQCYKRKLSSHKGINLPNSNYKMSALTAYDIQNLPFVCTHADILGYSFVRNETDVETLYNELGKYNTDKLGIVFKIENEAAYKNLPEILLQGMQHHTIGVMIARGDLAVEVGFERISEIQQQILWICESAHIPVIWATQVLENLAKTGIPTRAEVSDATMGAHAECIMLNKGPYINHAITTLEEILIRMKSYGFKRKNAVRPLGLAKITTQKLLKDTPISV